MLLGVLTVMVAAPGSGGQTGVPTLEQLVQEAISANPEIEASADSHQRRPVARVRARRLVPATEKGAPQAGGTRTWQAIVNTGARESQEE